MATKNFSGIAKKGTYICDCCGKKTRETHPTAAALNLCEACYKESVIENYMNDYDLTEEEATKKYQEFDSVK